ncbi:hypothetical protein HGRIS_000798 [Hohenbuehelia grisea]|uniref:F-box domain-containing protein n=1 Tax=Hohenbuehelia grisea TaxID=104357 RepID=A0ABR3IPS0_9AGAR
MPLVLDRFRSWNYFLPGLEDAPIITDLFSGHEAKYHPQSPLRASFSKLCMVDAVHPPSPIPQPQRIGTRFPSIHKLPTELIADIFALCHAMEEDDRQNSVTDCARVILSHVCSRWRAVILSMPLVWATISVRGPKDSSLPRLKAHLERSASCPLSLRFVAHVSTAKQKGEHIEDIVAPAIAHARRWKSLHIFLDDTHTPVISNMLRTTSFPSLETLELSVRDWEPEDAHHVLDALSSSCRLQNLMWHGPGGLPPSTRWAALAKIRIFNFLSLPEVHTLLSQCHNVTDLRISISRAPHSPLDGMALITLSKLEVLWLSTKSVLDDLFDRLCLPKLKRLIIENHCPNPSHDRSCRSLDSFLARCHCDLDALVLRDSHKSPEALDQLLRLPTLGTLRDLRIELPPLSDLTLETLTQRMDGACVLPRLENLTFRRSYSTDGMLGEMATSRFRGADRELPVNCLKRLQTALDSSRPMDIWALDALEAQGMEIDYGYW